MDDLALQVGVVHGIVVDDPEGPDARAEVQGGGRSEPTGADPEDARVEQAQLAFLADLGDQEVARGSAGALGSSSAAGGRAVAVRFQSLKPPASETTFS